MNLFEVPNIKQIQPTRGISTTGLAVSWHELGMHHSAVVIEPNTRAFQYDKMMRLQSSALKHAGSDRTLLRRA